MRLETWTMGSGQVASLRDEAEFRERAPGGALLMLSEGRSALAWNSWSPVSFWGAVRGRARLAGREVQTDLGPDEIFVAESGSRVSFQAAGGQDASLVGVMIAPEWIQDVARREFGEVLEEPAVFPTLLRQDSTVSVPLLHLVHAALRRSEEPMANERLLREVVMQVLRRQREFEPGVARCPGRSARYRRQLFLRLLRARNHIELGGGADGSLARLAEIARLSPTHFLRLYRDVFGQTPHRHVTQTRLFAARELLLGSRLGVSEICRTLGFENRCAFARVFRQHFGTSPTAMRQAQQPETVRTEAARPRRAEGVGATSPR